VRRPVFIGIFARLKGDREFWTGTVWRRERDSNPRYGFPHTHFPGPKHLAALASPGPCRCSVRCIAAAPEKDDHAPDRCGATWTGQIVCYLQLLRAPACAGGSPPFADVRLAGLAIRLRAGAPAPKCSFAHPSAGRGLIGRQLGRRSGRAVPWALPGSMDNSSSSASMLVKPRHGVGFF
jgi:hypothetical protein